MDSGHSAIKDKRTYKFRQIIEQYGVYLTLVILLIISALITPNMIKMKHFPSSSDNVLSLE